VVNRVYLARAIEQEHAVQGAAGLAARVATQAATDLAVVKTQLADPAVAKPGDAVAVARRALLEEQRTRLEALLRAFSD